MTQELYRLPSGGRLRAAGLYPAVVVGLMSAMLLSLWAATQWLAYRWQYAPSLGRPMTTPATAWSSTVLLLGLLAAAGTIALALSRWKQWAVPVGFLALYCLVIGLVPLYPPWHCLVWWARFHWVADTRPVWGEAVRLMVIVAAVLTSGTIWTAVRRAHTVGGQSDIHGSARWATWTDVVRAGLVRPSGVYLGAWERKREVRYLRHDGPQHVLHVAPTRSGKGANMVVPSLLTWEGGVICNDPKAGENWKLTAGWRKAQGNLCLRFDPTCRDGSAAQYNPLLEIRPWPHDVRDAQTVAQAIMERSQHERASSGDWIHWRNTAESLLVATILHVLYAEPEKTLTCCFRLLSNPDVPIGTVLERMRTTAHDPAGVCGWTDTQGQPTQTHPVVAHAIRAVENKSPNERSSVISTAIAYFNLYEDPIVAQNIQRCDFALRDVLNQDQAVSLYLTTPVSDLTRVKPLTRIIICQLLTRLTEQVIDPSLGWTDSAGRRTLLLLDEFPLLGEMRPFHESLAALAGFGLKVVLIAQDLSQIYDHYGRHESITANCDIRVVFAPNTIETAEALSKMLGQRTVHKEQRTYTGSRFALYLPHVIASETEVQRPLLAPDEIMRLPPTDAIILVSGCPPMHGKKIHYYEDAEFMRRASLPAPEASDRIQHDWSQWLTRTAQPAVRVESEGEQRTSDLF